MKLVVINDKLIGKNLAVPIYNTNGMLYMNKGVELSASAISKIKKIGINTVYIEDGNDEFTLQEVISPLVKINLLKKLNNEFNNIQKTKAINSKPIYEIVAELIENINLSENAFMFNNISKLDESMNLAIHSIDVAILSIMVGTNKKYDHNKLTNLAIGALLHDVGKVITSDLEHTNIGYKIVKTDARFSPTSSIVVLHHHERVDGKGYPDKVTGEKIYEFAKIVAICDEYINYTSGEKVYFPLEVIEKITAETNRKFDPYILKDLTSSIYCYPNGVRVRLNTEEEGIVIMQNKEFPLRPVIQISGTAPKKYINLLKELTVFIDRIIIEE